MIYFIYIKGNKNESKFMNGLIFKKNISNKKMRIDINNPRIVILGIVQYFDKFF